jgi:hypothetical protein
MNPLERKRLDRFLTADQRQRINDLISILLICLIVLLAAGAGFSKMMSLRVYAVRQTETDSALAIVSFLCTDLASDDQARIEAHQIDVRYGPHDQRFRARQALFKRRMAHAVVRQHECSTLAASVLKGRTP